MSVCLQCLRTVGFVLNVGQQNPSYVKRRRAGGQMQEESCWWLCSCGHGGGCGAHQAARALQAVNRERRGTAKSAPMMKTVLSLHRKWAHAVKTIRILQGLVSATPLPPARVGADAWSGSWDFTGSVSVPGVSEMGRGGAVVRVSCLAF